MARRQTSQRRLRQPSVGDMRDPIGLVESRQLNTFSLNNPYGAQHIETPVTVFAKVESVANRREFDGIELENRPTHAFTIRYRAGVTHESTFTHKGDYYRVVSVDHLEERREFMILYAKLRGDETRAAAR